MRKVIVTALASLTVFASVFAFGATPAFAEIRSDEAATVGASEVIDDDLFVAGETVNIDGTVNGDVYTAARHINVNGTINGDLLAAGDTLNVSGTVSQDIRFAGYHLVLRGQEVGDSVTFMGSKLSVEPDTFVAGGLLFLGQELDFLGALGRGITGAGQTFTINGSVGGTVEVGADSLVLGSDANVSGDVKYRSDEEATIDPSAQVGGEVAFTRVEGSSQPAANEAWKVARGIQLWMYLSAVLTALVLLALAPKAIKNAAERVVSQPAPSIGIGFLAMLLIAPVSIILMVTLIGLPLALIMLALFVIASYLAQIVVGYGVGRLLLTQVLNMQEPNKYLTVIVGLSLYYLVGLIPVIGAFIGFFVWLFGLGATVLAVFYALRNTSMRGTVEVPTPPSSTPEQQAAQSPGKSKNSKPKKSEPKKSKKSNGKKKSK